MEMGREAYEFVLCLLFLFMVISEAEDNEVSGKEGSIPDKESVFHGNAEKTDITEIGMHVVVIAGEDIYALDSFLHSTCRLGYPSVEVLRAWCPSGRCEEDSRLEDHLRGLPSRDLIIVADIRWEFAYLLASYEDTKEQLIASAKPLIIVRPPLTPLSKQGKVEAQERNEGSSQAEKENMINEDDKDQKNGCSVKKSSEEEGRTVKNNEENCNKGGAEGRSGGEGQSRSRAKIREDLLETLQVGGAVLGRVGHLLKALKEQDLKSDDILYDTSATHVIFGGRQPGGLTVGIPIRTKFVPDGGSENMVYSPFLVYNENDNIDFYNTIEAAGEGPQSCSYTRTREAIDGEEGSLPVLMVAVLAGGQWSPFLEEVLEGLTLQDYPKGNIHVWFHAKSGLQETEIETFKMKFQDEYASLRVEKDVALNLSTFQRKCEEVSCEFFVLMEMQALLEDPTTLSVLVQADRPVVAPLLLQKKRNGATNFIYKSEGDSQWDNLIRKRVFRSNLQVREVKTFLVIRNDVLAKMHEGVKAGQYINTAVAPGVLVDPSGYREGKKHPNLWGVVHNRYIWNKRYIHPDLIKIIKKEMRPEVLGSYLYYVPFFSQRFCQDIIEEMEHFGQWYDAEVDDREDSAHQYSSRNINLQEIGFAKEYHIVLNTVHKELIAALYGGYRAVAEASLIFVLKYADNTHYNTFKYHLDGATYTLNIALNNAFTGGGIQFKLGNKHLDPEVREFLVPHNRTGWAVVQPNRPLHVHRGVALDSGVRYAMINIIDTNDAGSKGGPKWITTV